MRRFLWKGLELGGSKGIAPISWCDLQTDQPDKVVGQSHES